MIMVMPVWFGLGFFPPLSILSAAIGTDPEGAGLPEGKHAYECTRTWQLTFVPAVPTGSFCLGPFPLGSSAVQRTGWRVSVYMAVSKLCSLK